MEKLLNKQQLQGLKFTKRDQVKREMRAKIVLMEGKTANRIQESEIQVTSL